MRLIAAGRLLGLLLLCRSLLLRSRGRVVRLAGIAGAGVLAWQADQQFLAQPTAPFGWAGLLWLGGMALLVIATTLMPSSLMMKGYSLRP